MFWTHDCRVSELNSVSKCSVAQWFPWSRSSGVRCCLCPRCWRCSALAEPRPLHLGTGSSSCPASTRTSVRDRKVGTVSAASWRKFGVKWAEPSSSACKHSEEARYGGSVSPSSGEAEEKRSRGRGEEGSPRGRLADRGGEGDSDSRALPPPSLPSPASDMGGRVGEAARAKWRTFSGVSSKFPHFTLSRARQRRARPSHWRARARQLRREHGVGCARRKSTPYKMEEEQVTREQNSSDCTRTKIIAQGLIFIKLTFLKAIRLIWSALDRKIGNQLLALYFRLQTI